MNKMIMLKTFEMGNEHPSFFNIGLKQYKYMVFYYIMDKICHKCNLNRSINNFRIYSNNSISNTCKSCDNEMDKLRKKKLREKNNNQRYMCEKCCIEKPLYSFAKLKKFYKSKICLDCYPTFLKEQKNEWHRKESFSNVNYRLKKSLAARLRKVILDKNVSTMNYVGCNIQYLKEWFEFNFTDEMSWDNYGKLWSIDHVIPVYYFDLTNEHEKLRCWNWSNLTPATIQYNSSKKNTIDSNQVNYIVERLIKFKEEGSTTKWFSEEYLLKNELVIQKINNSS
jgi:hypothetical protein